MTRSRIQIEAMLAAALASGAFDLAGPEISMPKRSDPEPDIYSSRNEKRVAKRQAQKAARRKNRK